MGIYLGGNTIIEQIGGEFFSLHTAHNVSNMLLQDPYSKHSPVSGPYTPPMRHILPVTAQCPQQNAAEILQSEGDADLLASTAAPPSEEKVETAQQVETTSSRGTTKGEPQQQQQEQQTKSTTPKRREKHLSAQSVDEDSLIEVSFTNTKWGYTGNL